MKRMVAASLTLIIALGFTFPAFAGWAVYKKSNGTCGVWEDGQERPRGFTTKLGRFQDRKSQAQEKMRKYVKSGECTSTVNE